MQPRRSARADIYDICTEVEQEAAIKQQIKLPLCRYRRGGGRDERDITRTLAQFQNGVAVDTLRSDPVVQTYYILVTTEEGQRCALFERCNAYTSLDRPLRELG